MSTGWSPDEPANEYRRRARIMAPVSATSIILTLNQQEREREEIDRTALLKETEWKIAAGALPYLQDDDASFQTGKWKSKEHCSTRSEHANDALFREMACLSKVSSGLPDDKVSMVSDNAYLQTTSVERITHPTLQEAHDNPVGCIMRPEFFIDCNRRHRDKEEPLRQDAIAEIRTRLVAT